jgi:uncharacterized protein
MLLTPLLHRKSRFDAGSSQYEPLAVATFALFAFQRLTAARMKLHAPANAGLLAITAYDAEHIAVNGRPLTRSFLLTPHRLIEGWSPVSFASLTEADFEAVAALACPIVLLGTGQRQRFPHPALLRALIDRRIGVEVMDSGAACRTYNVLMAEGREVAAALIIECAT